ncbi:arginine--tRNA ligase [Kitasatospora sp. NPDC002227]|uniref:arginine--tRNA ligase n=1 Tax=Kitasatospora sp. NPDC002227 TaxID=3154773 RepID=UPI00331C5C61
MTNLEELLHERLSAAYETVTGEVVEPLVRRSQHAHFQSDAALPTAKRLGLPPRELAARVVAAAELGDLCSGVEISGPGFVNLTVSDAALARLLTTSAADPRLGVPEAAEPRRVVVDYSGPNAAKEMHVGHLRSTIIGDAAVRVLEWQGHQVVKQNHIGEWGTPFGMLVEHLLDVGEAEAAHELSVGDLSGFYRAARAKFDASEEYQERSRRRVVLLQSGDATTLRLWQQLVEESKNYFLTVYQLLGVRLGPADFRGESAYNDQLPAILEELARLGLLEESAGADCVFPGEHRNRAGDPLPLIVRKSDGGFGYGATDLATIRYRLGELAADRLLYVVGSPQRQHLQMVRETAEEAGWLRAPATAEHIGFGSVLGSDGRMLRTRAGASVKLVDLLTEAVARATAVIAEKNPELDGTARAAVARAVGIGAVKYADLATDRQKDYVFDFDRMLSFEGNTAPYLQYARARICSIFRRAQVTAEGLTVTRLTEPAERELALELLGFGQVVGAVGETLEFHRLAGYLFGLAGAFTSFYEHCPVLGSEGELRTSRLALCDLTARTLAVGLDLLGIETPDRM